MSVQDGSPPYPSSAFRAATFANTLTVNEFATAGVVKKKVAKIIMGHALTKRIITGMRRTMH